MKIALTEEIRTPVDQNIRNSQQLQLGGDDVVVYQVKAFREINHARANDNALGIRGGKPVM